MKIVVLLLFMGIMQVSATTHAQTITYQKKDVSLKQIFKEIRKQTGYDVLTSSEKFDQVPHQDVNFKETPLNDVLQTIFQNTSLSYELDGKNIVIVEKKSNLFEKLQKLVASSSDVQGVITDTTGFPLSGASVKLYGTKYSTTSDNKGKFLFSSVPMGKYRLIVTYIGYQTMDREIAIDKTPVNLNLVLHSVSSQLDQIQIIAYGNTTERLNTGDVTSINAKDIQNQPVSNPLLALQGRVSGLVINQSTGLPGSGVSVQIRGQNSIRSGNDPFYVIDGVPYTSQLLSGSGFILGYSGVNNAQFGNPLSYINLQDIESISVLKDADATAIYGSRAANGAILITTKKGKLGDTKVNFNVQQGWGQLAHTVRLLNTPQYLQMRHEAIKNDGGAIDPTSDYDLTLWDTTRNTNWQKTLIGNLSHYSDASTSISGGNELTQFIISGDFHRQSSVFAEDFADIKGSMHVNINNVSKNKKFKTNFTANYVVDNNKLPNYDPTADALTLAPDAPSLYQKSGLLNWEENTSGSNTFQNPLATLLNTYQNKTTNLIANTTLSYEIIPALFVQSNFGYNNLHTNELVENPLSSHAPSEQPYDVRSTVYGDNDINTWIIEPQLNYKKTIGKGVLSFLSGATVERENRNSNTLYGSGYNSDDVLDNIGSATSISASSQASVYKYFAIFGRINYNLNNELILNLTGRRDGSSRFGENHKFADFGAAGIGWIFSESTFFKDNFSFLSYGKLRSSYGTTGNDQIGDYSYLSLYNPQQNAIPYQGVSSLVPSGLNNPNLEWEKTRKFDIALETGFVSNRILFTVNYSQNRSSNQLVPVNLPIVTGFSTYLSNFPGTIQNTSWEYTINSTNIKTSNFNWVTNLNLTVPNNKLIAFPDLANSVFKDILVIGQPVSVIKVLKFNGVDPATGVYKVVSPSDPNPVYPNDYTVLENTLPRFYGGFQNSISYKNIRLDFLFDFTKKKGIDPSFLQFFPGVFNLNQYVSVLNRWQKPGDITNIQRYNADYSLVGPYFNAYSSDLAYVDASYIKLRNASLSWQFDAKWIKSAHIDNLRIFLQGQNLLTITHYKGLDPETQGATLPPLRVITAGLQVGL